MAKSCWLASLFILLKGENSRDVCLCEIKILFYFSELCGDRVFDSCGFYK